MAKLSPDTPTIHPECDIHASDLGAYCEVGRGSRILNSTFGDYSYCDRYADIANATIGKFSNIAAHTRIGATDHPLNTAACHHFLYRSASYWDDVEDDADFFAHRASRRATIGHDTWIGHGAMVKPEVTLGDGVVVAAGALVTKDVAPYLVVAGVPAKPLRERLSPTLAERMMALAWWDWSHDDLRAALFDFRALPAEAFLEKYSG